MGYLFYTHRSPDTQMTIYPADVVLFEGILVFYFPAIRDLFHMKLFVDTDSDTRLSRRGIVTFYIIQLYLKRFSVLIISSNIEAQSIPQDKLCDTFSDNSIATKKIFCEDNDWNPFLF